MSTLCWSCERDNAGQAFCPACNAVQPPAGEDHFQVLGLDRRYAIDVAEVEQRYKALTRQLHPDRFARADPRARRASLARSVQLNEAWKTLRDPVRRAEYLLSLLGIEVGGEEGTQRRSANGNRERVPVPQALLMEVMELREGLLDARSDGDEARIGALSTDVRGRRDRALTEMATALESLPVGAASAAAGVSTTPETPMSGTTDPLARATSALVAIRYYDRFLDEVATHEEARSEASHVG